MIDDEWDTASPRATIRALSALSAEDLCALLNQALDIADRTYWLQRHPQCFVRSEAVNWHASHMQRSVPEVLAVAQALTALGLLVQVAHEHEHPLHADKLYYRLAVSSGADALDPGQVLAQMMEPSGVPIADRSHPSKHNPRCWIGSDAVDHLVARHRLRRHDAWVSLHRLMQFGLIDHVTHARRFIDGTFNYRFTGVPADEDDR